MICEQNAFRMRHEALSSFLKSLGMALTGDMNSTVPRRYVFLLPAFSHPFYTIMWFTVLYLSDKIDEARAVALWISFDPLIGLGLNCVSESQSDPRRQHAESTRFSWVSAFIHPRITLRHASASLRSRLCEPPFGSQSRQLGTKVQIIALRRAVLWGERGCCLLCLPAMSLLSASDVSAFAISVYGFAVCLCCLPHCCVCFCSVFVSSLAYHLCFDTVYVATTLILCTLQLLWYCVRCRWCFELLAEPIPSHLMLVVLSKTLQDFFKITAKRCTKWGLPTHCDNAFGLIQFQTER